MPWKVVKRKCKQSDGTVGAYVVVKEKAGGGTEQESCHTSEDKAKAAVRARYASKNEGRLFMKLSRRQLRKIISEEAKKYQAAERNRQDIDIELIEEVYAAYVKDGILGALAVFFKQQIISLRLFSDIVLSPEKLADLKKIYDEQGTEALIIEIQNVTPQWVT
jgi:DNA polymerase II small subunit/DNA polymerase delta subunit B